VNLNTAWVVEWSHSQQAMHIQTLEDSIVANVEMLTEGIVSDYTIISVWDTEDKAMIAAKALDPILKGWPS
jgi:hypothetical protein